MLKSINCIPVRRSYERWARCIGDRIGDRRGFLKYYSKSDADSVAYFNNESSLLGILTKHPTVSSCVPRLLACSDGMILMSPIVEELNIARLNKVYFLQLVRTLRVIHQELGIIHRDLQPDNILRNSELDHIFLIDWACSAKTEPCVPCDGTIFYATEELIPLVFTETKYRPKSGHDLESVVKILYHVFNQAKMDDCDMDVCQLDEGKQWWRAALSEAPWPSYLQAARDENYDALMEIILERFGDE